MVPESFGLSPTEASTSLSWLWRLFGSHNANKEKTHAVTIPKYPAVEGDVNLATALQYGQASAQSQLQDFLKCFISEVYRPAFEDWTALIDTGNTDGYANSMTLQSPLLTMII